MGVNHTYRWIHVPAKPSVQIYAAQHSLTLAASTLTNASIVIVCGGYWAGGESSFSPTCSTTNGTVSQYVDRGSFYSAGNDTTHARICAYITNFNKSTSMTVSVDRLYNNTGLYLIVI